MKITKKDIEQMVKEIYAFCKKEHIGKYEFILFYNGCSYGNVSKNWRKPRLGRRNNQDPHDWCEYYSENNIIAIACDGQMYDLLNGDYGYGLYEKFEEIFKKYNCYLECCDSCHYDVVYLGDDVDVEYTVWKKEEIIYLYTEDRAPDDQIKNIMISWYELSKDVGDIGSCVIGAYMEFVYKGQKYRMSPQSPYQGSVSWESPLEIVKTMLKNVGAEGIYFNYGRLD